MFMDNNNHNDFIDDELFESFLCLAREEINRDITLILLPDAIKRLADVMKLIKEILEENCDEDYSLSTEHIKLDPTSILVQLETDSFAITGNSYPQFVKLVNKIDNFESRALVTGRMRYYFGLRNFFHEVELEGEYI